LAGTFQQITTHAFPTNSYRIWLHKATLKVFALLWTDIGLVAPRQKKKKIYLENNQKFGVGKMF